MDQLSRSFYELKFEMAFYKKSANEFQDFFSEIMEKCHPGDFSRTRPWGSVGDRKNDGYLWSIRTLFQVYAPDEMTAKKAIDKINQDFYGAVKYWQKHFDKWIFVHNSMKGLGPDILARLLELNDYHENITVTPPWGFEVLRKKAFATLSEVDFALLLGTAPSSRNMYEMRFENVQEVLRHIAKQEPSLVQNFQPVSPEKLKFNQLSENVQGLLTAGMQKARLVENFFAKHNNPLYGDEIAAAFNAKYNECRRLEMSPDTIFHELQAFTGGSERGLPTDEAAVLAVLAYFFEQCEIFERPPLPVEVVL